MRKGPSSSAHQPVRFLGTFSSFHSLQARRYHRSSRLVSSRLLKVPQTHPGAMGASPASHSSLAIIRRLELWYEDVTDCFRRLMVPPESGPRTKRLFLGFLFMSLLSRSLVFSSSQVLGFLVDSQSLADPALRLFIPREIFCRSLRITAITKRLAS